MSSVLQTGIKSHCRVNVFPKRVAARLQFHISVLAALSKKIKAVTCIVAKFKFYLYSLQQLHCTCFVVLTQRRVGKYLNDTCDFCCNVNQPYFFI